MNVPENLKFAETHEWVRVEGDIATVGITEHAQSEMTDIVYAEPPAVGRILSAGETAAVVESVKAASDIFAPVGGEVIEANTEIEAAPSLLNTDPFGAGWIFKVRLADPSELGRLKSPEEYRAQIA